MLIVSLIPTLSTPVLHAHTLNVSITSFSCRPSKIPRINSDSEQSKSTEPLLIAGNSECAYCATCGVTQSSLSTLNTDLTSRYSCIFRTKHRISYRSAVLPLVVHPSAAFQAFRPYRRYMTALLGPVAAMTPIVQ